MNKQETYNKIVEPLQIGTWEVNLKNNTILWDTKTKKLFGVADNFIPNYKNILVFFNRKSLNQLKILIKSSIENKLPIHGKFQIITAKKIVKHIECICLVDFVNDKPNRFYGTFKDATHTEEKNIALESTSEKFASVFSSTNDAIIIFDTATGEITDCNNQTYQLTGHSDTELIGSHNSMLFPVENRPKIELFLKNKIKSNTSFHKEAYIKTKSERLVPVEITSGKQFIINNRTFLVCFFKNITKKKKNEENLNLLLLVASETTDSIIITNAEGKTIWANQNYTKLINSTLEEIIGQKPNCLSVAEKTNLEAVYKITKALKNQKEIKVIFYNSNKRKEKHWLEVNMIPVFDKKGHCIKFISIIRDVTATKEKEIELKSILEITNQQNNKLLNFAHIVSHNIRSHTSNLLMILEVIENTDNALEKLAFIDMFKEATGKLAETIENLNEMITIKNNANIKKTNINFKTEFEKIANPLQNEIKIIYTVPDDLTLNIIPTYLDNILQNLLSNAIQYQSPERNPELEISYEKEDKFHVIKLKDNGLGINIKRNKHKIFGMYKTFHGNENAKGIGLYIVKNQIEAMKGKIEVESEEGIGSTFKLYFNEK